MKTAEELMQTVDRTWFDTETFEEYEVIKFIKQIQLDAYKAGMTAAAEICAEYASGERANLHINAILSARDKKETI